MAGADFGLDAGGAEGGEALAGDGGVGVNGGGDDAADAGGDEGLGAGRGAAGVVAGLEGDVGCAAAETCGIGGFASIRRKTRNGWAPAA